MKNADVNEVREVVNNYIASIGDAMTEEEKEKEQTNLRKLTAF